MLVFHISNLITNISWPLRHPSACSWVIVPFIRDTGAYILLDIYMLPRVLFFMKIHSLTSPCLFQTTHFQHLFLLKILELQLLCFLLYLQRQPWFILQSFLLLLQILLVLSSQINKLIKHFQVNTLIIHLHPLPHVSILIVLLPPFPNRILMYPWFRYPSSLLLPLLNRLLLVSSVSTHSKQKQPVVPFLLPSTHPMQTRSKSGIFKPNLLTVTACPNQKMYLLLLLILIGKNP